MKNLLHFAAVLLIFVSCSKDNVDNLDNADNAEKIATTYEIINNSEKFESDIEYLDGTLWEVVVYQYIGDDIAKQENIDPIEYGGGTSGKIVVDENIEKLKISFKMLPKESDYYDLSTNNRKYVVAYKFIESGINNVVKFDDSTQVGGSLKSVSVNGENTLKRTMESFLK